MENTWNFQDLYPTDQDWQESLQKIASEFDGILQYKTKLATSPDILLECLQLESQISKQLAQLYTYASLKSDQDTRQSEPLGKKQQTEQLISDFSAKASFIAPEVAEMDKSRIDDFLQKQPKLKIYQVPLYDLQRTKAHRLPEPQENILAQTSLIADSPESIYSILSNAELPFPKVTLSSGDQVTIDHAGFNKHRASQNRTDREKVFDAFWKTFGSFKQTFGASLYSIVKKDYFYAKVRNYNSSLESAVDKYNIPLQVYHNLIENVNKNLDTFARFLTLKKRLLGLDQLKYSDLYAPAVKDIDLEFTYTQAEQLVLESLKPLGSGYIQTAQKCFNQRWIDVYPTPGKRSGAYSNGSAYDVHPYILLNFNGKYNDVSTLTHELGHAMHSYYSNITQPYPTSHYSIFAAEVASTFNEALLIRKMIDDTEDKNIRLSLLMTYLEGIKGTVFRQTQFAEFELAIHEMVEKNQPLTDQSLTELYGQILKKYYSHDQGICHINPSHFVEWSYIPHFYYNFYVYQYATSFTASTALVDNLLTGQKDAQEKYLNFLTSGSSDYPINLLKKAGVDMTTPHPFEKTMKVMNQTIDQIESILNE